MPSTIRLHPVLVRSLRPPRVRRRGGLLSWPHRLVELLGEWQERHRQRAQLQRLDDYLLKDIALTRADIEGEARKRFWIP
jgi:uncharacterized protein YjiS (DUF1127 family)